MTKEKKRKRTLRNAQEKKNKRGVSGTAKHQQKTNAQEPMTAPRETTHTQTPRQEPTYPLHNPQLFEEKLRWQPAPTGTGSTPSSLSSGTDQNITPTVPPATSSHAMPTGSQPITPEHINVNPLASSNAIPTGSQPNSAAQARKRTWPRRGVRGGRNYQKDVAVSASLRSTIAEQKGIADALRQVAREGKGEGGDRKREPTTNELYAALAYKAKMWFLNKDLKSNRDYMIVRHQVLQAGRHCGLHDRPGTMGNILEIVRKAHADACVERSNTGREIAEAKQPGVFMQGFMLSMPTVPTMPHETPIATVSRLEATEPWTMTSGNVYMWSGLFLRCLGGAIVEETTKCLYSRFILQRIKLFVGTIPTRYFKESVRYWTQLLGRYIGTFPIFDVLAGAVTSKRMARALTSLSTLDIVASEDAPIPMYEPPMQLPVAVNTMLDFLNPFWYASLYEAQGDMKVALVRHVAHTGLMCLSRTFLGLPGSILTHTIYNFASCLYTNSTAAMLDVTAIYNNSLVRSDLCLDHLETKRIETQDEYKYTQFEQRCQPNFGTRTLFGVEGFVSHVHRSCHHNEVISLEGRIGKKLPMHESPELTTKVKSRWKKTKTVRNRMIAMIGDVKPLKFNEWLAKFNASQKLLFSGIYESKEYYDKWSADTFLKREKAIHAVYTFLYVFYKDPRNISACPKWMVVKAGRWIRAIAKSICSNFRPYSVQDVFAGKHIVYTCGLSNEKIGMAFTEAVQIVSEMLAPGEHLMYIEDDQSRFDLHLTEGAFKTLDFMYRQLMPKSLCYTLKRGVSKAFTMLGNRYSVPYTMQSGWPDTSVADTLLNSVMKLELHGIGGPWITIINGDDSVTVTTSGYLNKLGIDNLKAGYADFGMEVSMKASRDYRDVEFCSARFVEGPIHHVLLPKTGKLLARICSDMKDRNPANYAGWARGIAITLKQFSGCDRLLGALGDAIESNFGDGKVIIERNEWQRYSDGTAKLPDFYQNLYYDHYYGLSVGEVERLVEHLKELQFPDRKSVV